MVGEKKYGGDIYAMELARPAGIGQQLRVYARPAWRARNPYPGMLADALVAQGVPVSELSYSWHPVPGEKKAILFFHWPDEFFFARNRSEEHTSELQSLMRTSYAVFCLKKHTHSTHKPITQPPTYSSQL